MNFVFNSQEHIKKMTPYVEKLVVYLNSKGILFSPSDGELENIVLTKDDKVVKIAYNCFYRFSGISKVYTHTAKNQVVMSDMTDDMFINNYMRSMIDFLFFGREDE